MVTRRSTNRVVFLIAAIVVVAVGWWQQRNVPQTVPAATKPAAQAPAPGRTFQPQAAAPEEASPIDQVPAAERPVLLETLSLVQRGGPFPYKQDGTVFQNREGHLPKRPRGYYREYTVPTPGAKNRGARRIVVGNDGDTWYTSDHYNTFVRIDE